MDTEEGKEEKEGDAAAAADDDLVDDDEEDEEEDDDDDSISDNNIDDFFHTIKLPNNFLIVYSSSRRHKTHRSKSSGSWMIDQLVKSTNGLDDQNRATLSFLESENEVSFLKLLVDVTRNIAFFRKTKHYKFTMVVDEKTRKVEKKHEFERGKRVKDRDIPGKKSAVTIYHTMIEPVLFAIACEHRAVDDKPAL